MRSAIPPSRRIGALLIALVLAFAAGCEAVTTPTPMAPTPVAPTPFDPLAPTPTGAPPVAPTPTPRVVTGPTRPGSLGNAWLHHTLLATDIDPTTGALVGLGDAFPEGTRQILVLLAWTEAPRGTELRLRVFQQGVLIFEQTHAVVRQWANDGDVGRVFGMVVDDGFPSDVYEVEIAFNGVPDERLSFTVGNVPRPGVLLGEGRGEGPIPYKDPSEVLVITRASVLRAHMGAAAEEVLAAAARVGDLHDLDQGGVIRDTPEQAAVLVHELLRSGRYRYLLILGNDDAVPYFRMPNPLREEEASVLEQDRLPAEWVASDDPYTDLDGDRWATPDFATARIPSSNDAELLLVQLGENIPPDGHGYALINQKRRSVGATIVAAMNSGTAVELDHSPPTTAERFAGGPGPQARYLYILLHGIGTWTETWEADVPKWTPEDPANPYAGEWTVEDRTYLTGVAIAGNPGSRGLVGVGACYGAWTLDTEVGHRHKTADNNLALMYLKSGVRAFVADTHLSYSWPQSLEQLPVARTGFEKIYWGLVGEGWAPIDAFQEAKVRTAAAMEPLINANEVLAAKITEKTIHYMVYLGRP